MPKLSEIATALRNVADALDKNPDSECARPYLSFHFWNGNKDQFLDLASAFPRPFSKKYEQREDGSLEIEHNNPALGTYARIPRSAVCEMVEPAKPAVYRCEPLLSDEEEATLTSAE